VQVLSIESGMLIVQVRNVLFNNACLL